MKPFKHNRVCEKSTYRSYDHGRGPCHRRGSHYKSNKIPLHGRRLRRRRSFELVLSPPTHWRWTAAPDECIQRSYLYNINPSKKDLMNTGKRIEWKVKNKKPPLKEKRIWKYCTPSPARWKRPWSHPILGGRIDAPPARQNGRQRIRYCTAHVLSPWRSCLWL